MCAHFIYSILICWVTTNQSCNLPVLLPLHHVLHRLTKTTKTPLLYLLGTGNHVNPGISNLHFICCHSIFPLLSTESLLALKGIFRFRSAVARMSTFFFQQYIPKYDSSISIGVPVKRFHPVIFCWIFDWVLVALVPLHLHRPRQREENLSL